VEGQVFIGMPAYNAEEFLPQAIDSLISQQHSNWKLLISDNASIDRTEGICREYANRDPRITYHRQSENLGALANFEYVFQRAEGDYFMWAATDDVWNERFIVACLNQLRQHPAAGFAFTDLVGIDQEGKVWRKLPSFSRFATRSRIRNIITYVLDYEVMWKACLIYSLYRLPFLRSAWKDLAHIWHDPDSMEAGGDFGMVMGLLARRPVAIHPEELFQRRCTADYPEEEKKRIASLKPGLKHCLPVKFHKIYTCYLIDACKGTRWKGLVYLLASFRHRRRRGLPLYALKKLWRH